MIGALIIIAFAAEINYPEEVEDIISAADGRLELLFNTLYVCIARLFRRINTHYQDAIYI
ncbi:hypothetical protein MYVALT_F_01420 [Candidatus Vallotia tarda]|uniref:Uncharacterized protein n=1 Tax=Candidatus Vallotiella hemipterorum TaxID=1177213 RepID=A0A916JTC3_9BURK|nr:hypothetical protein MYVALT_F_01420 [Candidatus Vallotia tarda]